MTAMRRASGWPPCTRRRPSSSPAAPPGAPKGVMQPYRAWNTNVVTQIMAWGLRAGRPLPRGGTDHAWHIHIHHADARDGRHPRPAGRPAAGRGARDARGGRHHDDLRAADDDPHHDAGARRRAPVLPRPAQPHLRGGADARRGDRAGRSGSSDPCSPSTYGQTEAPQIATVISAAELEREDRRSSVGRATALTRVATLDERGRALPPSEVGRDRDPRRSGDDRLLAPAREDRRGAARRLADDRRPGEPRRGGVPLHQGALEGRRDLGRLQRLSRRRRARARPPPRRRGLRGLRRSGREVGRGPSMRPSSGPAREPRTRTRSGPGRGPSSAR